MKNVNVSDKMKVEAWQAELKSKKKLLISKLAFVEVVLNENMFEGSSHVEEKSTSTCLNIYFELHWEAKMDHVVGRVYTRDNSRERST